jgi:hypothetical protein
MHLDVSRWRRTFGAALVGMVGTMTVAHVGLAQTGGPTPTPPVENKPLPSMMATDAEQADSDWVIHYKGITLQPIGFFAGEAVFRNKNETTDIASSFNAIPFDGTTNARLTEFRGSARQSRLGLMASGMATPDLKLSGYWESDFLSAGVTSNSNESNSYTFRLRQFWAQAALSNGFTFTGGQMWTLLTTARAGVDPRSEFYPVVIDAQYVPGFDWARQWAFRFSEAFSKHAAAAISIEAPQATTGGHGIPYQVLYGQAGVSPLTTTGNYSTDLTPDVIAKLAFDAPVAHFELKAVGSTFRDRIVDTTKASLFGGSRTIVRTGGGVGFGLGVKPAGKFVDIGLSGLWGRGIGRYGTSQLPDATARPDGDIDPIRAAHGLFSIELHPTSKLDIYDYLGGEYEYRDAYTTGAGKPVGYGSPLASNAGCEIESFSTNTANYNPGAGTCNADTRIIWQDAVGFWYRFYNGKAGRIQWGVEYSYTNRETWSGLDGVQPNAIIGMVFTSVRYYLP